MSVRFDPKEGLLHCVGSFEVKLEHHQIQRSDSSAKKMIGLSVGEVATVKLRLVGRRG
jgi:transcription elongation GreA/GreB family factor